MKTDKQTPTQFKYNSDEVTDIITGFTGIVVGKTEWLNGCIRYGIQSKTLKDGLPVDIQWFDSPQLVLVTKCEEGEEEINKTYRPVVSLSRRNLDPQYKF